MKPDSTNGLDRPKVEIKRRANVAGAVSKERSISRLIGVLPMTQKCYPAIQRRHMHLGPLALISECPSIRPPVAPALA